MAAATLDAELIRTFVAICETGSFRAGAERVHRTPSAVSMQMAKLEEQIGKPVFAKEGRTVRITAAGSEFLGYARRILSLHEEALARVNGPALSGLVRIGVPDDFELRLLPRALSAFAAVCADAEIEVMVETSQVLLSRIESGQVDVALLEGGSVGDLVGELVHVEPLVWLGRVGGTAKDRRPLPVALAGPSCYWRHTARDALERAGVPHRLAYSSTYSYAQVPAVHADLAICPLPASYRVPGLERVGAECGLPDLGTISVRLAVSPEAEETALALADAIRNTLGQDAPTALRPERASVATLLEATA
ncbi:LysR family transcriptional regulator [Acuticoccus sp. MNP-M23]|uniref:LysR family transcriptional regulator n=1 Tax=Acuticoccus sp. MNP-M23 TaxID=3072793 RepID=UPI002815892C|nr:LysR family transcriptional regulator [Acuticoccus sp. MNP-M23]WMS42130.1 LysR family transcriptional regulator [Acuticoccus sp. MNP-M23]